MTEQAKRPTVVISSDTMGAGPEELGRILLKSFIHSLTELDASPQAVIFLNSGATLTCEGAGTLDDLRLLEQKGTAVFTCGTCANYFGVQDKTAVGVITNMYDIAQRMAGAERLINI